MTTMNMHHADDPKTQLLATVGDISHIRLMHNQILVATYVRPEKTKGGLVLPDKVRKEDEYQGKVGLVIAKGPLAFVDDGATDFRGQDVAIGDWIAYRQSDGWQLVLKNATSGAQHCRMLQDIDVKAVLSSPDDLM